jgi:hypothetical protein
MTTLDELKAIRARHEAVESDGRFPWLPDDLSWHEDYGQAAHRDRATLLRLLDAAREELDKEQVSHLKTRAKLTGIREASELIAGPVAWLDSWAKHVSNCKGGYICTCGLVLARQEALGALEALTRAQGESS